MHHDNERDEHQPSPASQKEKKEKAEGSRENTNAPRGGELPPESFGEGGQGGGLSNRPIGDEQGRQQNVPPRGERRDDQEAGR